MLAPQKPRPEAPPRFLALPRWARVGTHPDRGENAAFLAGAALSAIDPIARSDYPLTTLWRRRLALKAAENLAKLDGRRENAADIRDHVCLAHDGNPGPAGAVFLALRALGDAPALEDFRPAPPDRLESDEQTWSELLIAAREIVTNGALDPITAAAAVAREAFARGPENLLSAVWLADAVLARRLRWPRPVPMLGAQLTRAGARAALPSTPQNGNSLGPAPDAFLPACILSYARAAAAAADLYADLARRADKLLAVAPRLRAKDAGTVVARLMTEDAQAAGPGKFASDRAGRRLFDRLVQLGGARELTGRATSRLYGL